MAELIAFRALQGLGAGGLIVGRSPIIGDIIPPRERGRYQGYFGAVFGVSTRRSGRCSAASSSTTSRGAGSSTSTCPIGAVAFAVIGAVLHMPAPARAAPIDYLGAGAAQRRRSRGLSSFTSLGGTSYAWGSAQIVGSDRDRRRPARRCSCSQERRAAEPIMPLELFRNRIFTTTSAIGFVVGLAMFGAIVYLPALPPDRHGRERDALRAAAAADDGGRPRHLDRQRPADHPLRALQGVPDRRHGGDDGRARAALAPRRRPSPTGSPPSTCWSSGSGSGWSCRCS